MFPLHFPVKTAQSRCTVPSGAPSGPKESCWNAPQPPIYPLCVTQTPFCHAEGTVPVLLKARLAVHFKKKSFQVPSCCFCSASPTSLMSSPTTMSSPFHIQKSMLDYAYFSLLNGQGTSSASRGSITPANLSHHSSSNSLTSTSLSSRLAPCCNAKSCSTDMSCLVIFSELL